MNLIFFQGKTVAADYHSHQLVKACHARSISCHTVDYNDPSTFTSATFTELIQSGDCAAVLFDDIGLSFTDENGQNIWKENKIPVYSYLLSYPHEELSYLIAPPAPLRVIIPDASWEAPLHKRFPAVDSFVFLPSGGTFEPLSEGDMRPIPFEKRDIDILCTDDCEINRSSNYPLPEYLSNQGNDFFTACISEQIRQPNKYAEDIIRDYFAAGKEVCTDEQLEELVSHHAGKISGTAYRFLQQEIIRALEQTGLTVEIYGANWESPDYVFQENIHLHPPVSPAEAARLTGRSKVALHFMPGFKQGADARFFDILQNGAVCVSTTNEYTERRFKDGTHMVRFDKANPNQTVADIQYLLTHAQAAAKIASKGAAVSERDTWEQRLTRLVELIQK